MAYRQQESGPTTTTKPQSDAVKEATEAIRNAGTAGTTTSTSRQTPLGIEEGGNTGYRARTGPYSVPGLQIYYSRDITAPTSWPKTQQTDWQMQLIAAGLLDPKKVNLGVWDSATQAAYKSILELANQAGLTKEEALSNTSKARKRLRQRGSDRKGHKLRSSN